MRRFLTFALPLALVMGLSTTSFGAVQGSFSGNEYSFDLGGPHVLDGDVLSVDLALPYMVDMTGFTFTGDFDSNGSGAFPIDLMLSVKDSSGTEHFSVGQGGDDDWDGSWPTSDEAGTYTDSFSMPTLALSGEAGTFITLDFDTSFGEPEWDNVSFVANVTAVPEPASAGLLGLGALVMLRRRRRTRVA